MKVNRNLSFNHVNRLLKLADQSPSVEFGIVDHIAYVNRPEITVAQVALWNEFGNEGGVPSRSFIRTTFKDRANMMTTIRLSGRKVIAGEMTIDAAMDELGKEGVEQIRKKIAKIASAGGNRESTKRNKGGRDTPLRDTDLMYDSIGYSKQ